MATDERGRPMWKHAPPVLMDEFKQAVKLDYYSTWPYAPNPYWLGHYQPIEDEV